MPNFDKCTLFQNFIACNECGRDCNDGSLSLPCIVCCKWFHKTCKNLTIAEYNNVATIHPHSYICSRKCYMLSLPFHNSTDLEFDSAIFGDGKMCCKICSLDCLEDRHRMSVCYVCNQLCHTECTENDPKANITVCNDRCYSQLLPFCNFTYNNLVKYDIFKLNIANNPQKEKNILKQPLVKDHVKFDRFLDINCSYLSPNQLDNNAMGKGASELLVFHNNVRSLNKNFDSILDTFSHCDILPDVLAVTETKLDDGKDAPELDGYDFECFNSSTNAGGVGAYISNDFNYTTRDDLRMDLPHCENL